MIASRRDRKKQRANHDRLRAEIFREYEEKVKNADPDALEASRDWGDNDGTPWRMETGATLIFLITGVVLFFLIMLFGAIKSLTS